MSTTPEQPEYLESGAGSPLAPEPAGPGGGGRRRGLLTALIMGRAEILGVALAVVGSALAAYLVLSTGERLSPPDPDKVAAAAEDGTKIPGDLEFDGWTPLLSLPTGTLLMLSSLFLVTNRRGGGQRGYEDYVDGSYPTQV